MTERIKDFEAMLHDSKDMPCVKVLTDEKSIRRYGGARMLLAPPIEYDRLVRQIPAGRVATSGEIRACLAGRYGADFTCPLTAGIFLSIVARASEQRKTDPTPYWRVLKTGGELNEKFPGGAEAQRQKLAAEGHTVLLRGRERQRLFVENYEQALWTFDED